MVDTDSGPVAARDLDPNRHKIKFVGDNGDILYTDKYVIDRQGSKKMVRIMAGGRTITVSEDHMVMTDRGYVRAGELKPGDEIVACD